MVMDGDVSVIESGGQSDFAYGGERHYAPAKVDRVLHDGDTVRLGGAVLVAHKTPGHTRGCTTWTMQVVEHGQPLQAVIVGSVHVNSEYRLVDAPGRPASYPGIAADFRHSFAVLRSLPCDIFLGAHGSSFDMLGKLRRQGATADVGTSVWVDPAGYQRAVAEGEDDFKRALRRQQAAARERR